MRATPSSARFGATWPWLIWRSFLRLAQSPFSSLPPSSIPFQVTRWLSGLVVLALARPSSTASRGSRIESAPSGRVDQPSREGVCPPTKTSGGHTLGRHVGLSDADLLARFGGQPGLKKNSSFYDLATAEAAIDGALRQQAQPIKAWLATSEPSKEFTAGAPGLSVGRQAVRTSAVGQPLVAPITDVEGIYMTLIRNPAMPGGYLILRAFPVALP